MVIKPPKELPESIVPRVTWRAVSPVDVISGTKSLGKLWRESRTISYRGEHVQTLLDWGRDELHAAADAATELERRRHLGNAISKAHMAIDCLFDAYLERDFLDIRMGARPGFAKKRRVLQLRLGDRMPWRLIPMVVADPRHIWEHRRESPTVEKARTAVEAAQAVVESMTLASHPLHGPALAGLLPGGSSSGRWGQHIYVTSLPKCFGLLWRGSDGIVRAGAGVSSADNVAEVLYCELISFTLREHLELLRLWDGPRGTCMGEAGLRRTMRLAGLDQPG